MLHLRKRTSCSTLAPIQLLLPELKRYILVLAFTDPIISLKALLGKMRLLLLSVFANEDDSQVNNAIYEISQGRLRCIDDVRYTSHSMYKLMNPDHAKSMALDYLHSIFRNNSNQLTLLLLAYGNVHPISYVDPSYNSSAWRSAKVLLYAAPRGQPHTDEHIFDGILHAFDFKNDILHNLGIDKDDLLRITYSKNMAMPFLTYQKYNTLLANRDMGVFVAVVHVSYAYRGEQDQGAAFSYVTPYTCIKKERHVFISKSPHMEMHVSDVWREWPEQS